MRIFCALSMALTVSLCVQAQVPTNLALGEIGIVGRLAELSIMNASGGSSTSFPTLNSTEVILWDPQNPDDFIVGSGNNNALGGYLNRVSFVAGGLTQISVLTPQGFLGRPAQLSWDQSGQNVIVASSASDQIYSVSASTGAVTPLTSGTQQWGGWLSCGTMDPLNGDLYVGTSLGDIYRVPAGGGPTTLFQTGYGSIQKILIDDRSGPHYLYFGTSTSFHRVDLANGMPVENFFTSASGSPINFLSGFSFDPQGDFVLVESSDLVWRLPNPTVIPMTGILPTFLGSIPYPVPAGQSYDVSVVGGTARPFRLTLQSVPPLGANIRIDNVPPGLQRGYLLLSADTSLAVGSGWFGGLQLDVMGLDILTLPPVPGGLLAFTNVPPAPLNLPSFSMTPFANLTWDGMAIALDATRIIGRSNVVRVTWL